MSDMPEWLKEEVTSITSYVQENFGQTRESAKLGADLIYLAYKCWTNAKKEERQKLKPIEDAPGAGGYILYSTKLDEFIKGVVQSDGRLKIQTYVYGLNETHFDYWTELPEMPK